MTNIKRILSATLAYVIIASSLTPAYATNIVDQSDRIGNTIESSISVTLDTEEDLTENRNESIYTISFVDGDCGRIDDKTPVETGTNGIIESLPATCPDDGYEFEKWVTIPDGNEVKSGDSLHLDITIKPIFKLIEKDSETDREENGELSSTCPHGKMQGDECSECGQLVSSDKNIPLLGYTQNYFDSIHCDEEEYCLLSIRMVCPHGVADGVYCCECDEVVDIQSSDVPTCLILDSCIHGKVKGEKCPDCRELKEQQGDYKPIEGEEWDDPLIYEVESTSTSSSAYYDRGDMYWYCLWCDDGGKQGSHSGATILDDRHNVQYHTKHGSCNGWSTVTGYTMSGDCNSHTVERKWACGYKDSRGTHTKSNNCKYNSSTSERVTTRPTCTATGKKTVTTSYGSGCTKCGTYQSSDSYDTTIDALNHIVTSYQYSNSDQHIPHCSGNNRSAHDLSATNHTWSTSGENQQCSANGCTAKKTKVHVDAYKLENGEPILLQNDIETVTWVEVGNNGPASVNASDYLAKAPTITGYTLMETQPQDNTTEVNVAEGGIHLAIYYTLKNFPKYIVSIEAKDYQSEYTRGEDFSTKGTLVLHYNDGTTGEVPMRESYIAPDTFPVSQSQPLGTMPVSVLYDITPDERRVDTSALRMKTIRNLLNKSDFNAENKKLVYTDGDKEYEAILSTANPTITNIINEINKNVAGNHVSLSTKDGSFIMHDETGMRIPLIPVSDLSKILAGEIATLYKHTDLCTIYNVEIVDNKKEIESIKVKNPTTEYYLSDPFDNRGEIEVRYTDGTTETIPLKSEYLKDFSTSELGNKPVHVEYKGMTDEYTIKVKPHELSLDVVQLGDTTSWVQKAEAEITYAGDADYLVYPNGEKDHDLDGNKKTYPITANGEYPFKLIGKDGSEIEKILKVENVDGEGSTYQLSVKNHALYIKTQDNLSGIKKITFPNGTMTEIVKPELGVKKPLTFVYNIKDLAEGVYPIQISDHAGNVTFIELEIPIDPEKIPVEGGTAEEPDEGSYKYTVTYHYDDQDTEVIEGYGKVGEKIPYDDSSPLIYNGHNYVLESYKVANEITRKEAENIVELYYTVDDKDELGNDNPDGIPDKYQSSLEDLLEKYNYKVNYTYLSENGISTFTMDSAGNYQLDGEETVSGLANVGAAIPFSMTSTRNYKSRQYGLAEIDVKSTVVTPVEDNNIVNLVYLFEEELEKPTIDKPIIENTTSTSIEVKPIEDGEYSIDDGKSWQDSPIFDGLKPDTEYEIIQRIPDPDNEGEYIVSDPTTATTDPDDSGNHGTHEVPPPAIKDTTPTSIEVKPIEDGEYSIDDGKSWQDSPIFDGLKPDTEYEIIQRIPDPDNEGEYIVSDPTTATTDPDDSGNHGTHEVPPPAIKDTTPTSIEVKPIEDGEYSIDDGETWQDSPIFDGLKPDTEYEIIQRIPDPDNEGEYIVSDPTTATTDPDDSGNHGTHEVPPPAIKDTTPTSIEVKPIKDGEYSIDDGKTWQDNPIFDGLKPNTEYEIIQRIPDPDNEGEYIVSDPTTATTDPDDSGNHGTHEVPLPVIKDTTPTSIEVKPIEDGEYSIDDGETWQDEPIFEGLAPDTEYEIIQRIPDPDHEGEYIVSEPTQSKTDSRIYSIHSPIVTNTTQTSITIKPIENGEYSINNGKTWQEQITFVGLRPNTRYKIIQRVPHPDFEGEYIVSDSTYGITDPRPIENSTKGIPAPIIKGTTTESIKVKSIEDGEYSIDGGRTWQDSPIFDGLEPNTEYEIIQRIPDPYSKGDYIVSRPTRATTDKRRFVSSNQENSNKRADNKNNTGDIPAQILNKKDHISYIAGYVDGTVRPEANIKRGEVAAIIYRLMMPEYRNINAGTMNRFSDGNNIWCSQEIMTTAAAGIISGYPDGSFRPNNNITRGEFAVIVSKFFDGNGVYNGILTDIHGHWAEQYIQRAFAANFISGYPDNTFRPDAFITRAEAVSIINRLLGRRPNISGMISTMKTWPDNMPGVWYYEAMQEATNTHEYVMNDDGEQWSVISDQ